MKKYGLTVGALPFLPPKEVDLEKLIIAIGEAMKGNLMQCLTCGRKFVPAKDCLNYSTGKWDKHSYKFDCMCDNPKLRFSRG